LLSSGAKTVSRVSKKKRRERDLVKRHLCITARPRVEEEQRHHFRRHKDLRQDWEGKRIHSHKKTNLSLHLQNEMHIPLHQRLGFHGYSDKKLKVLIWKTGRSTTYTKGRKINEKAYVPSRHECIPDDKSERLNTER